MNDETPDIQTSSSSGEASHQPDAGREPATVKKKRTKISAKAATAAIEARIGHKFADASLLATAITHAIAPKTAGGGALGAGRVQCLCYMLWSWSGCVLRSCCCDTIVETCAIAS